MSRSEIKGTARSAYAGLLRCRTALLEGVEDPEVMLTPFDMDEMYPMAKDMQIVLTDIKKLFNKFGSVTEVRREISEVVKV